MSWAFLWVLFLSSSSAELGAEGHTNQAFTSVEAIFSLRSVASAEEGSSISPHKGIAFSRVEALISLRCIECHGAEKQKGGLRLDNHMSALKGGDSGSPALDADLEVSELYKRLISEDPGIRMPKGKDPLSEKQIEVVREWLEGGADWPEGYVIETSEDVDLPPEWLVAVGNFAEDNKRIGYAIAAALLLLLLGERLRSWRAGRFAGIRILYPAVIGAGLAVGFFLQSRLEVRKRQVVEAKNRELQGGGRVKSDPLNPAPIVYRPQAPPRLGGRWYRGNDERGNEGLYNNGFYCTTIFDVRLEDSKGTQLDWSAGTNGDLLLTIDLLRAPFATPQLFKDSRMEGVRLSDALPGVPAAEGNRVFSLEMLESGEHWRVEIPIPEPMPEATQSSVFYVYSGPEDSEGIFSSPHYALGYDLRWKDGVLLEDSEVWMGVVYLGNVFVPPEGKIMLNEWFDARPLPMIEGGNTEDPHALGLPEHLGGLEER